MKNRIIYRFKNALVFSLLILFLGYYGSITLFYHSHVILGDTLVHSHPYKTNSHGIPSHSHPDKAYITIQYLAVIATTFIFYYFSFRALAPVVHEIAQKVSQGSVIYRYYTLALLRAPPACHLQ